MDIISLEKLKKEKYFRGISPECCATCQFYVWKENNSPWGDHWHYVCEKLDYDEVSNLNLCDFYQRKK